MKAKEYIIQKLVETGRRHRWMKYPMLALVSLISFFFLVLEKCIERPKRAVIVLVCMVLIISQGWYLISLAEEEVNPGEINQESIVPADLEAVDAGEETMDADDGQPMDSVEPEGAPVAQADEIYQLQCFPNTFGTYAGYTDNIQNDTYIRAGLSEADIPDIIPPAPALRNDYQGCYRFNGWALTSTGALYKGPTDHMTVGDWAHGTMVYTDHTLALYAYWERIGYKITYSNEGSRLGTELATLVDDSATVPVKEQTDFPGLAKAGYHFIGWYKDGVPYEANVLTFNGKNENDVVMTPNWEANQYTIHFLPGGDGKTVEGEMPDLTCTYDKWETLPVPVSANGQFKREGYSFAGWKVVTPGLNDTNKVYKPDGEFSALNLTAEENGIVELEAQWIYNIAGFPPDYTFTYGDNVKEVVEVKREVENGDPDFRVTLDVDKITGMTDDGIALNKDNYSSITGLWVNPASTQVEHWAGFDLLTKNSRGVQTTGVLELHFIVEDLRNPFKDDGVTSTTVYPTVTIYMNPKALTITGIEKTTKTYDGNAVIGVGALTFEGLIKGDDVRVYSKDQNGVFSDVNAGIGKDITLTPVLEGPSAQYYRVPESVTLKGIGTITKRLVHVTPIPIYEENKNYILTGETPVYRTDITLADLPEAVADADQAIIEGAIGQDAYTSDYMPDYRLGNFSVGIDAAKVNLQNYELVVSPGLLQVHQENPYEQRDYQIIGSQLPNNPWYYGEPPRVTPTGDVAEYDRVRITNDASDQARTCNDASGFSPEVLVTEDMYKENQDTTLYIQLGKSTTGAVTSMQKIELMVDTTAPVIDEKGIEVRSANTGGFSKVANFLSFGNFFQESQRVFVPVTDNLSGARTLTYWLGDAIWEDGTEVEITNGRAVIEIPMDYKGTIAFIADDNAGNTTTKANLIGIEGGELWVIENQAPEVRVSAIDPAGNTVYSGDDKYYTTVTMVAETKDLDSGVAYLMWNVTRDGVPITENAKEEVDDRSRLLNDYDFEREFTESGKYAVSVTAYDNADNASVPTTVYRFSVDGTAPEIKVSPEDYDAEWCTERVITFTVVDKGSGVAMLTLEGPDYQPYPFEAVEGKDNAYTFTVNQKGIFTIRAVDGAGNAIELPLEFTRVSSEVPEAPKVTTRPVNPQNVEKGWFTSNPEIRITAPDKTMDGTGITAYYRLWKEGEEEPAEGKKVMGNFQLPGEGIWNLRAWTETESGMKSAAEEVLQLQYDETAPVISDITVNGTGTGNQVSFRVTELPGCLETVEAIYNNDTTKAQRLSFTYMGGGVYAAGFNAAMKGSYQIRATDAAGHTAYANALEPIHITVSNISGNMENGILITGRVEAGSFQLDSLTVKYGSTGQELNLNAESLLVTTDVNGDKAFTAKLTQLDEDSQYRFLITAFTENGDSANYTGVFKTDMRNVAGISVSGTVHDEMLSENAADPISVALYDGNDILQYQSIKNNEAFLFTNLPDGVYMVRAMNGTRSTSIGLVIQNQTLVEPTNAIQLVLRAGQSTSVEYSGSNIPPILVTGLENLFGDTTNFGSDRDYAVIDAGGSVEFSMLIKGMSESEVPAGDIALLQRNLGSKERVAMYMDFSIWKRCVGTYGFISENQITSISGGKKIRIVIPLSNALAVQEGLSVLRVHNGSLDRLPDLDSNPYTYTIESALFSTYALVYTDNSTTENPNSTADTSNTGSTNSTNSTDSSSSTTENPGGSTANTSSNGGITDISKSQQNTSLVSKAGSNGSPGTGDSEPIIWIGILGFVTMAMGTLVLKKKKNR